MIRIASRKILMLAAFAATVALSLPLIAGFFGTLHEAFDSMAHFRAHLAVLMMLSALPLLFGKFIREGIVALALAIAAFATTGLVPVPGLSPVHAGLQPVDEHLPRYRLLQLNLRYNNPEPNKVLSLIGRVRPDVITFDEVSEMWTSRLELLSATYPHTIRCPYPNTVFGVAILSKRPLVAGSEARCDERGAFAVAPIDFGGRAVDIAALHLSWPWPFEQSWQIEGLAPSLAALADTALLAGDFNATPWSAAVSRVGELGGLTLAPLVGPTWQSHRLPQFLRFAGLPIDHVLYKGDVMIHAADTLEDAGSDHLPVLVEFSLKTKAPSPDEETATATVSLTSPLRTGS
ncbi:endonuclease/exonuclease/phosphatase family protein [Pseudaminobacter sp. NGMCC 1.201702]|uniref:endonuclease/exonuclease/phosphatase family protein n=1 Tax=Pseudaminobacter sp. NGMCC 1.201702 TaxID=3391825 RepID=UPI0039EFAB73